MLLHFGMFSNTSKIRVKYSLYFIKIKNNGYLIITVPNHTSYDGKFYKEFWAT